jgi:hypothetical protein
MLTKNFIYKNYFVIVEQQHNGSFRAVADNDVDRFGVVFYDYSMSEIVKRIKQQCSYRIANGFIN